MKKTNKFLHVRLLPLSFLLYMTLFNSCSRHTIPAVGAEKILSNPDIKSRQQKLEIFPKNMRENYL